MLGWKWGNYQSGPRPFSCPFLRVQYLWPLLVRHQLDAQYFVCMLCPQRWWQESLHDQCWHGLGVFLQGSEKLRDMVTWRRQGFKCLVYMHAQAHSCFCYVENDLYYLTSSFWLLENKNHNQQSYFKRMYFYIFPYYTCGLDTFFFVALLEIFFLGAAATWVFVCPNFTMSAHEFITRIERGGGEKK